MMSTKAATTVRRAIKAVDPPRRFSPVLKPRRRTYSFVTLLTCVAGLLLLRTPVKLFAAPKPGSEVLSTRVSISLDKPAGKCLKHVLYDKPVKTGSTAIMFALRAYLKLDGRKDKPCGRLGAFSCLERAKSICNGTHQEKDYFSLLGHLNFASSDLVKCLRPNYYVATSVREPYQRRKSAYLWNRTENGTHFSIPHTASFREFMERLPRCQLYHYYDGRGMKCDVGISLEQRIEEIVQRVDEVIDIYDEPIGPLHKRIVRFLAKENESIKVAEEEYIEEFDRDTLKEEQMLYDRLREIRLRKPDANRLPC